MLHSWCRRFLLLTDGKRARVLINLHLPGDCHLVGCWYAARSTTNSSRSTESPCGGPFVRPRRRLAHFVMFHLARSLMTRAGCNVTDLPFTAVCLLAASIAKPANSNSVCGGLLLHSWSGLAIMGNRRLLVR